MCHYILVYCAEILRWDWNIYWYEDSWFCVVENGSWCGCMVLCYRIIKYDIQRIDCWEVFMWGYKHRLLIYCLCGTVGPWVKVPTALKEDTPMWVYEVGLALGFYSRKTQGWSSRSMSPKRHGAWLALGWCPRIVIIILIMYLVEH